MSLSAWSRAYGSSYARAWRPPSATRGGGGVPRGVSGCCLDGRNDRPRRRAGSPRASSVLCSSLSWSPRRAVPTNAPPKPVPSHQRHQDSSHHHTSPFRAHPSASQPPKQQPTGLSRHHGPISSSTSFPAPLHPTLSAKPTRSHPHPPPSPPPRLLPESIRSRSMFILSSSLPSTVPTSSVADRVRKYSTSLHPTDYTKPKDTLPPALLARARTLADEHDQLQRQLASGFDATLAKRCGELSRVVEALRSWEKADEALDELDQIIHTPLTTKGGEPGEEAELMRQLAMEDWHATVELRAQSAHALTVALTPKHPFADMPCLVEFRPGPGGMEGRFFTDTLFRMYKQYLQRHHFHVKVAKYEVADSAGDSTGAAGENPIQEAILEVTDAGAYDALRGEAGIHRVQRVPVTESKGRTHTSAVAVWVLPSFPDSSTDEANDWNNPESDFYIPVEEVRQEVMRARGAGGQHVNKTESAVRLTHIPTGTVVSLQDSRSQQRNRDAAWRLLRSRVAQQRREEREEQAYQLRNSVLARDRLTRADKIRTYNYGQDRCTDHRSGLDVHNLPDVLQGGETLDKVIDSVRTWLVGRDIRAMMADEEQT